ncbi:MAG: Zn-ribbon domain-containing OB-fold protein [Acidimicrobiales bacterium]
MSEQVPPRFVDCDDLDRFYWTSGADGQLRLHHCDDCDRFHHPPSPVCPYCHSRSVGPAPVSGRGRVTTFTINHQEFMPGFEVPFVFAFVEVDEDPSIRLGTNIVNCEHDDVQIDMAVQVTFEVNGDYHIPLFEPAEGD